MIHDTVDDWLTLGGGGYVLGCKLKQLFKSIKGLSLKIVTEQIGPVANVTLGELADLYQKLHGL